jgi:hypothetical protein
MKLIQAVKLIMEAALTPELRCRTDAVGKEALTLFGMRRWHRDTRYSSYDELDVVVCVNVEGGSIGKFDAKMIKDDIVEGMAKILAREAAAKTAGGRAA